MKLRAAALAVLVVAACAKSLRHAERVRHRMEITMAVVAPDVANVTQSEIDKVEDIVHKVKGIDVPRMVQEDVGTLMETFMPGWRFVMHAFILSIGSITVALAWLIVYFRFLIKHDRMDDMPEGSLQHMARDEDIAERLEIKPDLVIVLHHPKWDYADKHNEVSQNSLDHILVKKSAYRGSREAQKKKDHDAFFRHLEEARHGASSHTPHGWLPHLDTSVVQGENPPTMEKVRIALIKDLYSSLPHDHIGFDVFIFCSVLRDELMLCVSLQKEQQISNHLLKRDYRLQVKQEIVERLDIVQPKTDPASSPPYLRYDLRTVKKLAQDSRKLKKVLSCNNPRELFQTHHGRDPQGSIASSMDRIRLIFTEIVTHFDLDAARNLGAIVDWYPVHSPSWIVKLKEKWANWGMLCDLTFVQPVPLLQKYFGSRLAFSFAWTGVYCKALLGLLPLAVLAESLAAGAKMYFNTSGVIQMLVLSFNIIIIVWSRIAANIWSREEQFFAKLWDLDPAMEDTTMRPSFQGTYDASDVDANRMEKQYSHRKAALRWLCSMFVTAFFCGLVANCIVTWYSLFRGRIDGTLSIFLAIQIKFFELLWNSIAPVLTEFENHKYQHAYYNSYLWKLFLFQAVNSFSPFFYIAVKLRYTDAGCPEGGCLVLLRMQLIMIQVILSLGHIFFLGFSYVVVQVRLRWEMHKVRQQTSEGAEEPRRSAVEEQSKFVEFRVREQIESMCQLMLSLGFVLLFGAIAPIMVPFSLAVFVLTLRTESIMLCTYTRRPLPRKQYGIGAWKDIANILMRAGVLFSGFLLVVFGDNFKGTSLITKLSGSIAFCLSMFAVWAVTDVLFPSKSVAAKTLAARRQYVLEKITQICEESKLDDDILQETPRPLMMQDLSRKLVTAVEEEDWDAIQRPIDTARGERPDVAVVRGPQ